MTNHPFVSTPNNGPCSSCGNSRAYSIHKVDDTLETRLYGVSTGNGNDGVSHTFADFYVRTHDPYLLAEAATYDSYKPQAWSYIDDSLTIDGEPEYTIYATLYEEPGKPENNEACPECNGEGWLLCNASTLSEDCPHCDGSGLADYVDCEQGPAAFILEVFPEDECNTHGKHIYPSIEDALGSKSLEHVRAKGKLIESL